MEAVEVVIAGKEKKDRILSEKERENRFVTTKLDHALATAVQKHTQPVQKITIVPRTMGSLRLYNANARRGRTLFDVERRNN